MSAETFVTQRRLLFAWGSLAALGVFIAIYVLGRPASGHHGATWLGYTYGCLAFAGMVFLMWYGAQKRYRHAKGESRLRTWLGAHVWIGLVLAVLVPLHSGFRFGANVHGAAYLLLLLTTASGAAGAWTYLVLPSRMRARREGVTSESAVEQIDVLSGEMVSMCKGRSAAFLRFANALDFPFEPGPGRILFGRPFPPLETGAVHSLPADERAAGMELVGLAHRRLRVCNQLLDEAGVAARMRIWLYVHLPLAFATLAAACAHVFWVLYYRWPFP